MVREKEEAGIGARAARVLRPIAAGVLGPIAGPKIWEEKEEEAAAVGATAVSPG